MRRLRFRLGILDLVCELIGCFLQVRSQPPAIRILERIQRKNQDAQELKVTELKRIFTTCNIDLRDRMGERMGILIENICRLDMNTPGWKVKREETNVCLK